MGNLDLNEDLTRYPEYVPQGYFRKEKPPPGFFPGLKWHISRHPRTYLSLIIGPVFCATVLYLVFGGETLHAPGVAPMAPVSFVHELERHAEGYYHVSGSNSLYQTYGIPAMGQLSVQITLGEKAKVRLLVRRGGWSYDTNWIDYPANQLIYVDGNVSGLSGDVTASLTLVVNGTTKITGNLRYVDPEGDPAYHLVDADGPIQDTGDGVAWDEVAIRYVANPRYNPPGPIVLGIVSRKDIEIVSTAGVNYNQEVHAAMLILDGNFHCELDQRMGNLRTAGSIVARAHGWRFTGPEGAGYVLSGAHIDDRQVPPYFRDADISVIGPVVRPK